MFRRFCAASLLSFLSVVIHGQEYGWAGTNSLAMPAVGDHALPIISPTILELTWLGPKPDEKSDPTPWDFVSGQLALQLPPKEAFQVQVNDKPTAIASVGFKRRPLYAPLKVRDLRILNQLYLELAAPIAPDTRVTVTNKDGKLWPRAARFEASSTPSRFSPAIHVNQTGYATTSPQRA